MAGIAKLGTRPYPSVIHPVIHPLIAWMLAAASALGAAAVLGLELEVEGEKFLIDGKPTFLSGVSYYGALGAPQEVIQHDLREIRQLGFNWIRVWATWAAFNHDVSAVDSEGRPRELFLRRLEDLVRRSDELGLVVDVTLSRGNGVTGPPRLRSIEEHRSAVEVLITRLRQYRNWYLDLGNERNLKDRFVSFEELRQLRQRAKELDPKRLITASHAGDISAEDLRSYVLECQLDFISPHRPRNAKSPRRTAELTRFYLDTMRKLGRVVPVHYQEPFRRGFSVGWDPTAEDYLVDLKGAIEAGAAGWCFHNGDQRHAPEGYPRRSFDLREKNLFAQLDPVEKAALQQISEFLHESRR